MSYPNLRHGSPGSPGSHAVSLHTNIRLPIFHDSALDGRDNGIGVLEDVEFPAGDLFGSWSPSLRDGAFTMP